MGDDGTGATTKTITALARGIELLRLLNVERVSHVRDLHKQTGIPKPTIVRMLLTLQKAGYITRAGGAGYRTTAKTLALSSGYHSADHLLSAARPILNALREEHTWPSDLAIFDRDAMVILNTGGAPGVMSLNRATGTRLPMTSTAFGRAYLAFAPREDLDAVIELLAERNDPLERLSRQPRKLKQMLQTARQLGYAVSDQEYRKNTRAVAVPVFSNGAVIACVNMMVIASVMTMSQAEAAFAPVLKDVANRVARRLDSG